MAGRKKTVRRTRTTELSARLDKLEERFEQLKQGLLDVMSMIEKM